MDIATSAAAALLKRSAREIESELRGSSMTPTLADGARIRIRCITGPCEVGDIVAILAEPLVAHRVVACTSCRSKRYLITRGDASWYCDLPVTEDQVLGIVTALHDGAAWRPLPPPKPVSRAKSLQAWLSLRLMLIALAFGEDWASWMARGSATIAGWGGGRA